MIYFQFPRKEFNKKTIERGEIIKLVHLITKDDGIKRTGVSRYKPIFPSNLQISIWRFYNRNSFELILLDTHNVLTDWNTFYMFGNDPDTWKEEKSHLYVLPKKFDGLQSNYSMNLILYSCDFFIRNVIVCRCQVANSISGQIKGKWKSNNVWERLHQLSTTCINFDFNWSKYLKKLPEYQVKLLENRNSNPSFFGGCCNFDFEGLEYEFELFQSMDPVEDDLGLFLLYWVMFGFYEFKHVDEIWFLIGELFKENLLGIYEILSYFVTYFKEISVFTTNKGKISWMVSYVLSKHFKRDTFASAKKMFN